MYWIFTWYGTSAVAAVTARAGSALQGRRTRGGSEDVYVCGCFSAPPWFRVSYLITTRGPEGLRLWGKRNNLGRPTPAKRRIVTSSVEQSSVLNYCPALSSGEFTSPSPRGRAPKLPGEQQTQCGKIIGKVLLLGPGQREHRKARLG